MPDITAAKQRACSAVGEIAPELFELSTKIHAHPEVAWTERKASANVARLAREHGFAVEERAHGIETAFRAVWGEGSPRIFICAEYDALPEIGHACGHNLIAACSAGAAIAASRALDPKDATIVLLGTPAEEGGGGKIRLIEAGAFEGADVAMMAHPGPVDFVYAIIMGGVRVKVDYYGKAAHQGATPEKGVNALDAIVTAYNAMAQLRQHIRRDARLACIITRGGDAVNVIPEHTSGEFSARAASAEYLWELRDRLTACIEAGALATGCDVQMHWSDVEYAPFRHSHALGDAYIENGRLLGKEFLDLSHFPAGGTDMANVSQVVPAIHPEFAIGGGLRIQNHTREFTEASRTDGAHEAMLDAARILAMTAVEVALEPDLLRRAQQEFKEAVR